MRSEKMQEALNDQMNAEMYSSYLYLSMAAYFEEQNLSGFAGWMEAQAQEEMMHAMKFYRFIIECGGRAKMAAIDAPPADWNSPLDVFEHVYDHECKVTERINDLVDLAKEENHKPSQVFLQWFVTEQVEEEASADEVVQKLKMVGDAAGPLFMLDRVMGQRQGGGEG